MHTMLPYNKKLASFFLLVTSLVSNITIAQNYDNYGLIPSYQTDVLSYRSNNVQDVAPIENELKIGFQYDVNLIRKYQVQDNKLDTVPHPKSVMYKSLILPGWGQIVNKQAWKIPIIYGLIAGVTTYTFYAHNRYKGYKAAYYNSFSDNTDLKFGPTPDFVIPGQPPELYRTNRNNFRNRRDMAIIGIVLAYGLNVADAYIFAHLRDFDVSDNLSGGIDVKSDYFADVSYPNWQFTLKF